MKNHLIESLVGWIAKMIAWTFIVRERIKVREPQFYNDFTNTVVGGNSIIDFSIKSLTNAMFAPSKLT